MARLSKEIYLNPLKNPHQAEIIYALASEEGNSNTLAKELKKSQSSLFDNIKFLESENILLKEGKYYRTNTVKILSYLLEIAKERILEELEYLKPMSNPKTYLSSLINPEKRKEAYQEDLLQWEQLLKTLNKNNQNINDNFFIQVILNSHIAYNNEKIILKDNLEEFILLFGNSDKDLLPKEEEILEFHHICRKISKQDLFNLELKMVKKQYLENKNKVN
jgi:hypothetical protein